MFSRHSDRFCNHLVRMLHVMQKTIRDRSIEHAIGIGKMLGIDAVELDLVSKPCSINIHHGDIEHSSGEVNRHDLQKSAPLCQLDWNLSGGSAKIDNSDRGSKRSRQISRRLAEW